MFDIQKDWNRSKEQFCVFSFYFCYLEFSHLKFLLIFNRQEARKEVEKNTVGDLKGMCRCQKIRIAPKNNSVCLVFIFVVSNFFILNFCSFLIDRRKERK